MNKPIRWYTSKKDRKLSPKAKVYLSFKLKEYYKDREEQKEEVTSRMRREPKEDDIVRIWVKWKYLKKDKPIFIEAYIEGFYNDYYDLLNLLHDKIKDGFGSEIAEMVEYGGEIEADRKREFSGSREIPIVYFKRSLEDRWRRL